MVSKGDGHEIALKGLKAVRLREMTIPRKDTRAAEPSTKKRGGIAPFHKLFKALLELRRVVLRKSYLL